MRLLLDTHIFLWWEGNNPKLSKAIQSKITSAQEVYISSVSIWESAIKIATGKLEANIDNLVKAINQEGFIELPVTIKHAATVSQLPDLHKDPFDRLLLAQAISEPLRFLTADKMLSQYSDIVEVV